MTSASDSTQVVVVTGLSGAGKSTALAALEDLGFHAIENLPPSITLHAIEACELAGVRAIALGFAGSVGAFAENAPEVLGALASAHRRVMVLFLDASDDALARRFNETRRPHPEAQRTKRLHLAGLHESVRLERERMASLRAMASVVVDTTGMRVHDLRKRVFSLVAPEQGGAGMKVRVLSFGFKYGLPSDADLVFDVRFLDNPHFVPGLRELTGEDKRVRDYVMSAEGAREFLEKTTDLLAFLVPRYAAEGKSYLTIAIGCTGGQHRSVTLANAIGAMLRTLGLHGTRAERPSGPEGTLGSAAGPRAIGATWTETPLGAGDVVVVHRDMPVTAATRSASNEAAPKKDAG